MKKKTPIARSETVEPNPFHKVAQKSKATLTQHAVVDPPAMRARSPLRLSYLLKHVLSSHLTVLFRGTVGRRCVCLLCVVAVATTATTVGRWYR